MVNESSFQKWKQCITQLLDVLSMGKKLAKRCNSREALIVARSFTKRARSNAVVWSVFRRNWNLHQASERLLSSHKSDAKLPFWRRIPSSLFLSLSFTVV